MARVIIILGLMIAITATMFWITRKPPATEASATPVTSATTVSLAELNSPKTPGPDSDIADKPDETQSQVSAEPRLVMNPAGEAQSGPASAQDVTRGPVAGAAPSIATAGLDYKNNASFTGTATPGDAVSLVWDEKPISWTTADAEGNWMLEFKAPDAKRAHELYVTAQGKDGSVIVGPQRASIGPAATPGGLARITLKAADQSTKTLQDGSTTAGEPATGIIVEKIATGSVVGEALLTGKADAGATVKVQINGKAAGEAVADAEGAWSLTAMNPSNKAADSVRLELFGKDGAKLDEAEVPYKVLAPEAKVAVAEPEATAKEPSAVLTSKPIAEGAAAAASAGVSALFHGPESVAAEKPKSRVIRVRRGDSLWRISKRHLGNGKKWAKFYRLNKRKIDNPDLIYPGQTLILPG
ncbi:MAG: LysM peptidoglycan-binding domain-containing protein [Alphaproteobacteria bacterium]|nr:LysM peptidoglycan-binding domain-containing protein [Alphaproteobacteria bacterium]